MTYITSTTINLRKATYKNIRTVLLNNVTSVGSKIYGSYPLKNITFPLIVIDSGIKSVPIEEQSLTQKQSDSITINLMIYAKQIEKVDTYADEVNTLLDAAYSTLKSYNLYLDINSIEDVDSGVFVDFNKNRSHYKTIAVTLKL